MRSSGGVGGEGPRGETPRRAAASKSRREESAAVRIFSLKCREVIDFLDRYLDGELPERERREFEWHLRL